MRELILGNRCLRKKQETPERRLWRGKLMKGRERRSSGATRVEMFGWKLMMDVLGAGFKG